MEKTSATMPQAFAEHPRNVFVCNIYINPLWEENWANEIRHLFAPSDVRKMMGSKMYALLGVTPKFT
jgi:hypothetical protein